MLPCHSILLNDPNYGPALSFSTPACSLDPGEHYLGSSVPMVGALLRHIHSTAICYFIVYMIKVGLMTFNYGPALSFSRPTCSLDPVEQNLGSSVPVAGALFRQIHL